MKQDYIYQNKKISVFYFRPKTMVVLFLSVFFLSGNLTVFAQWQNQLWIENQANNWCFGNKVGWNFETGFPEYFSDVQANAGEGSTTISNANGELLFYAAIDK